MMDGPPNHQCARELISSCIFSQILILMLSLIFVPGVCSLALSTSICRCLIDSSIAFRKFFLTTSDPCPFSILFSLFFVLLYTCVSYPIEGVPCPLFPVLPFPASLKGPTIHRIAIHDGVDVVAPSGMGFNLIICHSSNYGRC